MSVPILVILALLYITEDDNTRETEMFDCNKDMKNYHTDEVNLPMTERGVMSERRNSNRTQMTSGLKRDKEPFVARYTSQGSYAMWTMIQDPDNDYDIDDGAYFNAEDLKDGLGLDRSASDIKQMVLKAVTKETYTTAPKVLENCVRVLYNDGSHVDIPSYRIKTDANNNEYYELASNDWKKSNPQAVTSWFQGENKAQSHDGKQLRWVVRLLKNFAREDEISGFMISKLVVEEFKDDKERLDRSLYNTMVAIKKRLDDSTCIEHPVIDGNLAEEGDSEPCEFRDQLSRAIDNLEVLFTGDCDEKSATEAWDKVFNTGYFTTEFEKRKKTNTATIKPKEPAQKVSGRYA